MASFLSDESIEVIIKQEKQQILWNYEVVDNIAYYETSIREKIETNIDRELSNSEWGTISLYLGETSEILKMRDNGDYFSDRQDEFSIGSWEELHVSMPGRMTEKRKKVLEENGFSVGDYGNISDYHHHYFYLTVYNPVQLTISIADDVIIEALLGCLSVLGESYQVNL